MPPVPDPIFWPDAFGGQWALVVAPDRRASSTREVVFFPAPRATFIRLEHDRQEPSTGLGPD